MPDNGDKKLLGQPLWVWGAGAAAVVVGYVILRRAKGKTTTPAATTPAATGTASSSPTGLSWDQFLLFLHDQQGTTTTTAPKPKPKPKPKPRPKPKPKKPQIQDPRIGAGDMAMTGAS